MSSTSSASQPLPDVLPWGAPLQPPASDARNAPPSVAAEARTLLVTDATSTATDGRFLLHSLALQFLSCRHSFASANAVEGGQLEGAVLWITCAPVTEKQILAGLRKGVQHNLGGGGGSGAPSGLMGGRADQGGVGGGSGRVHIVSVPLELADAALEAGGDAASFSHEGYLKQLHQRVLHWLRHRELLSMQQSAKESSRESSIAGPNLIIIDNATALATLFGDKLAAAFISSVRSLLKKHTKKSREPKTNASSPNAQSSITITNLLAIRAASPDDGGLYHFDSDSELKGEQLRSEYSRLLRPWLGFGSGMPSTNDGAGENLPQMEEQAAHLSLSPNLVPSFVYRSGLYEVADGIVDVSPLESGYARDVLGRLSFTPTWNGRGWWGVASGASGASAGGKAAHREGADAAYASLCVNYRCDDGGVRVMRLRSR